VIASQTSAARRNILAGTVGSVLEWYDNTQSLVVMLVLIVPSAILSDRIGRKPMLCVITIGMFALAWPLWWLMHQGSFATILAGQAGFAVLIGLAEDRRRR
jgi:MFS family permease